MLQLSLGYVIQAEREREVTEDLRNRQSLRPPRDSRTANFGHERSAESLLKGSKTPGLLWWALHEFSFDAPRRWPAHWHPWHHALPQ